MIGDPSKQLGYLQQCLSSDKRPLGLFLGAGCPTSIQTASGGNTPLIPDIAGMTAIVREQLAEDKSCGPLLRIVDENLKNDGCNNVTVEDMLTHIRALRAVAGQDEVRGLSADNLDMLDSTICQAIHEIVNRTLPNSETPYHRTASWVAAVQRENPVEVFTTNYDLLMEQAFEDCRVPYFDGFAGASRPFFDLRAIEEDCLPPRWARLWKLHGSINWFYVAGEGVFRSAMTQDGGAKRVIHPSHLKYQESRRLPYLAMFDRLKAFLRTATATLVVCGYSFRDDHINEVIVQGLQSNQTAVAFALLHGNVASNPHGVCLATKRPNLNVLAIDGAVVAGQVLQWPEKDPETVSAENGRWLVWRPVNATDPEGRKRAEFVLGDFAVFGDFLGELLGTVRAASEAAYGK